ncbi:MAG: MFS transporter [Actinomycetota bacterium]|nr:MFS transporter [Actinomycetota bacterium]
MSRHFTGRRLGLLGREPSFRSLFLATLGSGLGTWLALVALQIDVLTRTHSPIWMSALLIADILPMLLVGLVAAPLVDRLSRRRLMVGADLVRFAVFCALPFAPNATTIVALAAVIGTATGFFRPAVYAGLPNLVSDEDLPQANSLLQTIDNSTWAIGSLAGGALVAASGPDLAYWINAVTFLVSAALLAQIPQRLMQEAKAETRGHWRDLADGLLLVRRSRALLTVLIAWNIGMIANAFVNVGEPFLATDTFSAGSFGLGLMMASAGVGLALGAYLAGSWIEDRGLANVYGVSLGLMGVGVAGAAASPNVWVAAVCVIVSGAGNGATIVCNALLVQRGAPDRFRGRAFTVLMSSNVTFLALGLVLGGRLTDAFGPRWVWGAAALLSGVSAVVGFTLARGVAKASPQAAELPETAVEPEPAVEAHSRTG